MRSWLQAVSARLASGCQNDGTRRTALSRIPFDRGPEFHPKKGELFIRQGIEQMAAAQQQGATQREIAKAVGKPLGWVNGMLKWRERGYRDDTPFGPQSKASRQRTARVQSIERGARAENTTSERERAENAKARRARAEAEAARAEAEARKAKADAAKAEAEAREAKANAYARSFRSTYRTPNKLSIPASVRSLLVKALGMLGSDHDGERANAAVVVEKQRIKLGMTWDQLIVRECDDEDDIDMDIDLDEEEPVS